MTFRIHYFSYSFKILIIFNLYADQRIFIKKRNNNILNVRKSLNNKVSSC